MAQPSDDSFGDRAFAQRIREQISRRRLSRQALADMARISLSTLEKALAGTRPFTLATKLRIEEALGLSQDAKPGSIIPETAPDSMGAYSRSAVAWVEGRYLTLRRSFGTPGGVYAYLTTISWLPDKGHLGFVESGRLDARFAQAGHVSMPNLSGHIYLVTNEAGQYRLVILSRPTMEGYLLGLLSTLQAGSGSQLVPMACSVALKKLSADADPALGLIVSEHADYQGYSEILNISTSDDFVRFRP